ncbi:MAG TPA: hypothetical protein VKH62_18080, partial [Candidatus Binatia bacterium]|nr:hypothetical protein [Candidatus Binatia bacterium]
MKVATSRSCAPFVPNHKVVAIAVDAPVHIVPNGKSKFFWTAAGESNLVNGEVSALREIFLGRIVMKRIGFHASYARALL